MIFILYLRTTARNFKDLSKKKFREFFFFLFFWGGGGGGGGTLSFEFHKIILNPTITDRNICLLGIFLSFFLKFFCSWFILTTDQLINKSSATLELMDKTVHCIVRILIEHMSEMRKCV